MNAVTVANWAIVVLLLTLAGLLLRWQIRRAHQADAERDQLLFGPTQAQTSSPQPVRDTTPGINLAAQDFCELTWAMPPYDPELDAECERLRQAIRDEQQKGELT